MLCICLGAVGRYGKVRYVLGESFAGTFAPLQKSLQKSFYAYVYDSLMMISGHLDDWDVHTLLG
jgi:hypothetical protein